MFNIPQECYQIVTPPIKPVMQHEHKTSLPETRLWRHMVWPPEPGYFFDVSLEVCRKQLLESGRSPKVTLHNGSNIVNLKYQCTKAKDGQSGLCMVKETIPHQKELGEWLARLPRQIDWNAERLPALTHKVLSELLRAERRSCPADLRKELLKAQDYRCAICGGIFDDDIEWDHLNPLQQTCAHQATKWQAICASCHLEKTTLEGKQDRTLE